MKKLNLGSYFLLFFITTIYVKNASPMSFSNPNEMLGYVKSFLPESPVILEAGGHLGEDTIRMKSFWPNSTIHVFEPLPNSFAEMRRATRNFKNIICYPYALTNYCGKTNFYVSANSGASSINYPVEWAERECGFSKIPIEVACTTIDAWAEENKIYNIDFMWLDMESHELYALQNSLKILKTVKAIYTEIDIVPIRINSGLYKDLKFFLESQGFIEVWKIEGRPGVQGEALFINKNFCK